MTRNLGGSIFEYKFPPKDSYGSHKVHKFYKKNNTWSCKCGTPIEIAMCGEHIRNCNECKFMVNVLLWNDHHNPFIIKHGEYKLNKKLNKVKWVPLPKTKRRNIMFTTSLAGCTVGS